MVLVVGGGVVGMSVAAELARRGHSVTLIEKGKIGYGCSYSNAGWMTPCFAMPLPRPGMFLKSIGMLLDPEGPLYIKPSPSFLLARWMWKFLLAMNQSQANQAIHDLVLLSKISLTEYERLAKEYPGAFGFEKKGLIMVAQSRDGWKDIQSDLKLVEAHQVPGKLMTSKEIKDLEPSLIGHIEGAVHFTEEAHGEPLAIVQTLKKEAEKFGAKILEEVELIKVEKENGQITRLLTSKGEMVADTYVIAAGTWSTELAKELDMKIPILGGKGYSIIVKPLTTQPKHPMMLLEKKVAITPRDGSLRIAGTLELVNQDFSVTEKRVKTMIKGAREFLHIDEKPQVIELWRGLRPCTPDGVPLIGFSGSLKNVMLATGHQMLGLQSATGTAKLLADQLEGKLPALSPTLFDPMRFS